MKNTTKKVEQLLRDNPEMRDNPKKLIRKALQEIYGVNVLSAVIVSDYYKEMERIMRSNRKAQSDNEELRGEKWKHRKEVLAPMVKKELGY
tara:strand:+ start:214 stop:486 length:273 start_codon:yes stop_codon:yes gene_type:complete